jgi:type I restriction enzyme, S subunit
MNAERLLAHYERIADAPDAIPRLRRFVLDLAVRGKLVPQNPSDEPASELLKRIAAEKERLVKAGKIKAPKAIGTLPDPPFSLPAAWCWSRIAEIGLLSPRNEVAGSLQASFVPMPLISADYGVAHEHEMRPWGEIKKGYTHFADGDVGLAKITPCFENGKSTLFSKLTGGIGSGTTELHVVRPILIDPNYILIFVKSPHFIETGIPKMTGTAGQKRVPLDYFAYSPFPLPPLAEQHRIVARVDELMALCDRFEAARVAREAVRDRLNAASLARLDAPNPDTFRDDAGFALGVLAALTARADQIRQFRQTILNLAVRGKLVPQDPNDEQASELLKRIADEKARMAKAGEIQKEKPLAPIDREIPFEIPPNWQWARLGAISSYIQRGKSPKYAKSNGVPVVSQKCIQWAGLDLSVAKQITAESLVDYEGLRFLRGGDLLWNSTGTGTIGRVIRVIDPPRNLVCDGHVTVVRSLVIDPEYIRTWLRSDQVYGLIEDRASGSTNQVELTLQMAINQLVPVPSLPEQHRIVAKVDELMALCDRLQSSLATADDIRCRLLDALLHEAIENHGEDAVGSPEAAAAQ